MNGTPTSKTLINNIKGFGASFQKVRKTGKHLHSKRVSTLVKPKTMDLKTGIG
jgi:hypothetical protein